MKNGQNLTELKALTRMFALSDIPVVALKGICLALTIYPDPGLRPMVDMDLLVPVSRLPDAMRIVRNAGYQAALPEAAPGHIETLNHAVCMVKGRCPFTTLELHRTLVGEEAFQFAVPVDWFWTQIEPLKRNSHKLRADDLSVLTPTAQILYACAHAMLLVKVDDELTDPSRNPVKSEPRSVLSGRTLEEITARD